MLRILSALLIANFVQAQAPAITSPAPAQEQPQTGSRIYLPGTKLYVKATGLAFRRGPSLETERIHYITRGDAVTVIEDNRVPVSFEAEGIKGHWIYVQHGAYKGYTFDGFLSPEPPAVDERVDWTVIPGERVGPITSRTTYQELVKEFGPQSVAEAMVDIAEGDTEPGTALFPGKVDRAIIQWQTYRVRPKAVHLTQEGSRWKTPDGFGVGTPLETLVQLNGKPITFAGLGSEEGGHVTNWNGGALASKYALGVKCDIGIGPADNYSQEDMLAVADMGEVSSDLALVKRLNPKIFRMVIHLAAGSAAPSGKTGTAPLAGATYPPDKELFTYASKLNMRSEAALGAAVVSAIPYGSRVRVASGMNPPVPLEAENLRGNWLGIEFSGQRGYVFDAYLLPLTVPRQECTSLADYAKNTLKLAGTPRREEREQGGQRIAVDINDYEGGVRLEEFSTGSGPAGGLGYALIVPDITPDQAVVFVRRCVPRLAQAAFSRNANGAISLTDGTTLITIRAEQGGLVRISQKDQAAPYQP